MNYISAQQNEREEIQIDAGNISIRSQSHNYVAEHQASRENSGGDSGQAGSVAFNNFEVWSQKIVENMGEGLALFKQDH